MSYSPHPFLGKGPEQLAAYVLEELTRVSVDLNSSQGAATLYRIAAPDAPMTVTTTPQKLIFEALTPQRDYRAIAGLVPSDLYVRRAGIMGVSFTIDGLIPGSQGYAVNLHVNDVAIGLYAAIDPSNQTAFGSMTAIGTFRVAGSDPQTVATKLDLRITVPSGSASFTFQKGYFSCWWLGD